VNVQAAKVTFAVAQTVVGSLGMVLIAQERYWEGVALILIALGIETVREWLKTKGIVVNNKKK